MNQGILCIKTKGSSGHENFKSQFQKSSREKHFRNVHSMASYPVPMDTQQFQHIKFGLARLKLVVQHILLLFLGGLGRFINISCRLAYASFGISEKQRIRLMLIRLLLHCHINVKCNNNIDGYNSKKSTQKCERIGRQII